MTYLDLEAALYPSATPAQVAADLGVSGQTVRNWRADNEAPPFVLRWLTVRRIMEDKRPFADVLGDWLARMGDGKPLSYYRAAKLLGVALQTPANWHQGGVCGTEPAIRALMGYIEATR